MIQADKTKCIQCYQCIKVCPFNVLGKNENGFPTKIEEKICLECMHCAAICPVDAFTFNGKSAVNEKKIEVVPENFSDHLKNHILTRRSYRHFESKAVDENIISEVLDTIRWTPSAKNVHPTKWIVINSKDIIDKMMDVILHHIREKGISQEVITEYEQGNNVVMGEANTLLIAYASDNAVNPVGDTYIAMTTAELLFQSHEIGSCWCGYLTRFLNSITELRELLPPLPEGNSFYASLSLGYPDNEKYIRIPERFNSVDIRWVR